jgi:hypothetical protein
VRWSWDLTSEIRRKASCYGQQRHGVDENLYEPELETPPHDVMCGRTPHVPDNLQHKLKEKIFN